METDIFSKYSPGRWRADGESVVEFPVQSISEEFVPRLTEHERLNRPGALLEDTGAKARKFTLQVPFVNGIEQPGVGKPDEQYPDAVNLLTGLCRKGLTGDLWVPTIGKIRAKSAGYQRIEDPNVARNTTTVVFSWLEDNEDSDEVSEPQFPSASSMAKRTKLEVEESAFELGMWGDDMKSLGESLAAVEALADAPGQYVAEMEANAGAIVGRVKNIEAKFGRVASDAFEETKNLLTDPAASRLGRQLRRVADVVVRTTDEKVRAARGGRKKTTMVFPTVVSIIDVSAKVNQPVELLIGLNPGIPDLLSIPAGEFVTVLI